MSRHSRPRASLWCAAAFVLAATACGRSKPPAPAPGSGGGVDTITGLERIGWDQPAPDAAELGTFRYAIYVDGVRSEIADVTCASIAAAGTFPCSGRLPPISNGSHVLELAAFVTTGGTVVEGARSAPLSVTVAAAGAGAIAPLISGDVVTTADGVRLRVELVADNLATPSSMAIAATGRIFVGSDAGVMHIIAPDGTTSAAATDGGAILGITLSPTYDRDQLVYVTQHVRGNGQSSFRTSRYRELRGQLGERMVVLENGPASSGPAAALRFGPDAKLYAAFDDGGSAAAAARMSEWSGKLLRMEPDGRTPADQPSASPVLWHSLTSPRGFDWTPEGSMLWIADASADRSERLRVVTMTGERPRRLGQRATHLLPRGLGAAAVTFYKSEVVREFQGDLFVAGRDGGYILRIRFDPNEPGRPATTERLLEGAAGTVRALEVGADGAIYFCTDTELWRLVRQR